MPDTTKPLWHPRASEEDGCFSQPKKKMLMGWDVSTRTHS